MNMSSKNKRMLILSAVIVISGLVLLAAIIGIKNIKVDDFKRAAVIFVIDSSASNQQYLPAQKKFVRNLCSTLDPEDTIKIIRVSENAYLIYEGSPQNGRGISKSMDIFTQFAPEDRGTAYGDGLQKALSHSIVMKENGYVPAVVVIGDLENEGNTAKQINWDRLPDEVKKVQAVAPEFSMMFLWAHPEKLDFVKGKLNPVLGEGHLIVATDQTIDKVSRPFFTALGR